MKFKDKSESFKQLMHYWTLTQDISIGSANSYYSWCIDQIKKDITSTLAEVSDHFNFLKGIQNDLNDALQSPYLRDFEGRDAQLIEKIWGSDNILLGANNAPYTGIFQIFDCNPTDFHWTVEANETIEEYCRQNQIEIESDFNFMWVHRYITSRLYFQATDDLKDFVTQQIILLNADRSPIEKINTIMTVEQIAVLFQLFYDYFVDASSKGTGAEAFKRTLVRTFNRQGQQEISVNSLKNKMLLFKRNKPRELLSEETKLSLQSFFSSCSAILEANNNFQKGNNDN
jgi:hypothetical protein